ncbi:hypothetical protein BJY00DRAFT_309334 [Aspergillus carlsbadensis]|nr:hypothetical protein BJY00DRAFT_309334 [Aspergillus carlsbadensis]
MSAKAMGIIEASSEVIAISHDFVRTCNGLTGDLRLARCWDWCKIDDNRWVPSEVGQVRLLRVIRRAAVSTNGVGRTSDDRKCILFSEVGEVAATREIHSRRLQNSKSKAGTLECGVPYDSEANELESAWMIWRDERRETAPSLSGDQQHLTALCDS